MSTTLTGKTIDLPYPGLRPFEEADAPVYYGRHTQIVSLVRQLRKKHFVAVIGASGSGKSSLVRAGLIPSIRQGALGSLGKWRIEVMKPGNNPIKNLASILNESSEIKEFSKTCDTVRKQILSTHGTMDKLLNELNYDSNHPFLIVVDQFEELFGFLNRDGLDQAHASRAEASAFVRFILNTIKSNNSQVRVVSTMRTDFMGHCEIFLGLPEAINSSQFLVPRLNREQLKDAIIRPASASGVTYRPFVFPESLADEIINEIGAKSDYLPLMQYSLMRTWEKASGNGNRKVTIIGRTSYQDSGGIQNSLNLGAEFAWEELQRQHPKLKGLCRQIFLLLCDEGQESRMTRRRPKVAEVRRLTGASISQIENILSVFQISNRNFLLPIIGQKNPPLTDESDLDISHEALLRNWETYKKWQKEELNDSTELKLLSHRASRSKKEEFSPLSYAEIHSLEGWKQRTNQQWAQRYIEPDSDVASYSQIKDFLSGSESYHKRKQWKKWGLGIAAVFILVTGLFIYARLENSRADAEARGAYAASQREFAEHQARVNAEAKNIVIAEYKRELTFRELENKKYAEKEDAYQGFLQDILREKNDLKKGLHEAALGSNLLNQISEVEIKAHIDSRFFALTGKSASNNPNRSSRPIVLAGHRNSVWGARFLNDGNVVSWSADGTIRRWNLKSRDKTITIHSNKKSFGITDGALLTINGLEYVMTGDAEGELKLFSLRNNKPIWTGKNQKNIITDLWVVPDPRSKQSLYSSSSDGNVVKWTMNSIDNWQASKPLKHPSVVSSVTSSRSGGYVVTSCDDESGRAWKGNDNVVTTRDKHAIRRAQCHPDWGVFVTPGSAKNLNWWSTHDSSASLGSWPAHKRPIISAKFSPQGTKLATGGGDGQVYIWHLESRENLFLAFKSQLEFKPFRMIENNQMGNQILTIAWSKDGKQLAAGSLDGTVYYRDLSSEPPVTKRLKIHTGPVWSVAFDNEGKRLVSASGYTSNNLPTPYTQSPKQSIPTYISDNNVVVWQLDNY